MNTLLPAIIAGVGATTVGALGVTECLSARQLYSLKRRRGRHRYGHAHILPYRALIKPDIIKLASGAFLAMYEIDAPDSGTSEPIDVARTDLGLAKAISAFDPCMVVHMHLRHTHYREYDQPRSYPQPELAWLDERRCETFTTQSFAHFTTRRVMSIAWLPPRISHTIDDEEAALNDFSTRLLHIENLFRSYGSVRRLGVSSFRDHSGQTVEKSEMLEHLAWCVAGRQTPMRIPPPGISLNGLLSQEFRGGQHMRVGDNDMRIVVVKGFPHESMPEVFNRLLELQVEYSLTLRWLPLLGSHAKKRMKKAHSEWLLQASESTHLIDPHSITMLEEARQAIGQVSAGTSFGMASIWITLFSRTKNSVEEAARQTVALLDELGYPAFTAHMTAEDEYCAQLPGDGYHGHRQYLLHAMNIAHLFSFHQQSMGRRHVDAPNCPSDTPALTYGVTHRNTPYRINLNDLPRDVFHHVGTGATGSGKSVALAHFAVQWIARMPNAGFTGIDRGRSLYRLTRFLGGNFYDLLGENGQSPGIALFRDIDDPQTARELLDLLCGFVEIQGVAITPQRRLILEEALESICSLEPGLRSLSAYCELIREPEEILIPALRVYTREGVLGHTLDCEEDTFDEAQSRFSVIEVGNLMGLRESIVVPVLTAAFWKSRTQIRRLKRQTQHGNLHWLYGIDEAHTMIRHPLGQRFILDLLKMGRKESIACGLWSNAITDFTDSPILNDILEACHTRFFFRSTAEDHSVTAFEAMGLPQRGIERLPMIAPFSMLMHQPVTHELQELSLALDPATLAVIGRSRDSDQRTLSRLITEYPQSWREEMLRYERVDESSIDRLSTLSAHARATHSQERILR